MDIGDGHRLGDHRSRDGTAVTADDAVRLLVPATDLPDYTEFDGVIAVHARTPQDVQWVVPLDTERINGVAQGPVPDTIVPPDERWYFVETPDGQQGWVSDNFTGPAICIG